MAFDMTTALTIKANVVGQQNITGLTDGIKKLNNRVGDTANGFGKLRNFASGALGALRNIIPVLGAAGIAAFAKSNLDSADAMSKLSDRTGVSAPVLDQFRKVAELSDTSIESLAKAFPALAANMDTAAQKMKGPAFEAFQRLGISVTDLDGKLLPVDQIMLQLADRFAEMKDGTEQAALAGDLFGSKLGSELIPLLNSGGDAVRGMSTALTDEFADSAAAFNDRLENMQEKFGDLGLRLTEALLPVLEGLVGALETIMGLFESLPTPVQTFIAGFAGLAGIALLFAPIVSALTAIGPLFSGLVTTIGGVVSALTGGGGFLAALAAVFTGPVGWAVLLVGAAAALYTFRDQIGSVLSNVGDAFVSAFEDTKSILNESWKGFESVLTGPVQNAFDFIDTNILAPLGNLFSNYIEFYKSTLKFLYDIFAEPVQQAYEFIDKNILSPLGDLFSAYIELYKGTLQFLYDVLIGPVSQAYEFIDKNILSPLGDLFNSYVEFYKKPWQVIYDVLIEPVARAVEFIDDDVLKPLINIAKKIVSNLGDIWEKLEDILFTPIGNAYQAIVANVLNPIVQTVSTAVRNISDSWGALASALTKPIETVVGVIRGLINSILGFFEGTVNGIIKGINKIISAANSISSKVKGPIFGLISTISLPRFADGGVVNRPTVAMVGEGGEPEYIVPQSKAGGFVQNWMAGKRGISAIPGFAEGGFVGPGAASPTVQITTGPVIQQDGQTYVTVSDLENALSTFGTRMIKSQRAYGARRYLGV